MNDPELELVADYDCETGEGPIWHPTEQRLYWIDIPNGKLFRYDPRTDEHEIAYERDGPIGGVTVEADDRLLLFEEEGRIEAFEDGETEVVRERLEGERGSRFNDVIADPDGRVFAGTMPQGESPGRLYRLDVDGSATVLEEDVAIPNGLGFTPDLDSMYFTETEADAVYRYDYDRERGALADPTTFVDASDEEGMPDGMTVDSTGHVWIAYWNGGCLIRRTQSGDRIDRVEFPARKVASVILGGPEYGTAYVACAGGDDKESEGEGAGALFRFDAGVRGLPEFRSRLAV